MYNVRFTNVGDNIGSYNINTNLNNTLSPVYEYIGINLGSYEPITRLIAPSKLQMAVINGDFTPNDKTKIAFEFAGSKNDLNLFSDRDDADNNGFASKLKVDQKLISSSNNWTLSAQFDADYINKNFKTIEQLYNVEFNRDWNLDNVSGNQQLTKASLNLSIPKNGNAVYSFEHLKFSDNFNGNRHLFPCQCKFQ